MQVFFLGKTRYKLGPHWDVQINHLKSRKLSQTIFKSTAEIAFNKNDPKIPRKTNVSLIKFNMQLNINV